MDIAFKGIKNVKHASIQRFKAECEALKQVHHRNIVKILTSCSSVDFQGNQFKALVFKCMQNGSLDSWLHPNSGKDLYLSLSERLDIAIDIAHALDYLHNHYETPIIHCDLKPYNILLDENMIANASDFNLAKVLLNVGDDSSCTSMLNGSIGYIAPGAAPHLSNETDRQALLAFKRLISSDPHNPALDSWNDSLHFCDWQGVVCGRRQQRVVELILLNLHLGCRISPHIGNLSFLRNIYLPNNSFHGEIPHELGRLSRL